MSISRYGEKEICPLKSKYYKILQGQLVATTNIMVDQQNGSLRQARTEGQAPDSKKLTVYNIWSKKIESLCFLLIQWQ